MSTNFKKVLTIITASAALLQFASCGSEKKKATDTYKSISGLDTKQEVSLKIAVVDETDTALNLISNEFMKKYPNVNISLEYIEDYSTNAVNLFKSNDVDIILLRDQIYYNNEITDEETGETYIDCSDDYFYNFADDAELDFSDTNPKIMGNYTHTRTDENGNEITYQYSVPLGGEIRGLFVNTTLLAEYGLSTPTNYTEFLNCCETLKNEGFVPIQGNPASAVTALGLATSVNEIVHNEDSYEKLKNAEPDVSELFRDTMSKIYNLSVNRYYDYKYIEENENQFKNATDLGQAKSFLSLSTDEETFEAIKPENNYGTVAFFPYLSSIETTIQALIDDNELDTTFEFIATPLNDEGENSAVYFTPFYGISANKNSENLIWIREFTNFIFDEANNKSYADAALIVPNTADAIECLAEKYNVDVEKDCSLCGEIYFSSDYNAYTPISIGLRDAGKCNAQKYMVKLEKNDDGSIKYYKDENGKEYLLTENEDIIYKEYIGEEDPYKTGYAFCTLDYYIDKLEGLFGEYRAD